MSGAAFGESAALAKRCKAHGTWKDLCLFDPYCMWCGTFRGDEGGTCLPGTDQSCTMSTNSVPTLNICLHPCSQLDDCRLCTSYRSYNLDVSNNKKSTFKCGWCQSTQSCVDHLSSLQKCREEILTDGNQCLHAQVTNGFYLSTVYNSNSIPSQATLFTPTKQLIHFRVKPASSTDDTSIVSSATSYARGFLHITINKAESLHFTMVVKHGNSRLKFPNCSSDDLSLTPLNSNQKSNLVYLNYRYGAKNLVKLKTNTINTSITCEFQVKFIHTDVHMNGVFNLKRSQIFNSAAEVSVSPYSSAVATASSSGSSCRQLYSDCISCAIDGSCAWCEQRSICVNKYQSNDVDDQQSCFDEDTSHIPLITLPQSCVNCRDFTTCRTCQSRHICRWNNNACYTGSNNEVRRTSTKCPVKCEQHQTCTSCLSNSGCYWCLESATCHHKYQHINQIIPCRQPRINQRDCVSCATKKSCYECLRNLDCIWCADAVDNPYKGHCSSANKPSSDDCDVTTKHVLRHNNKCPMMNECEFDKSVHGCDINADCIDTTWYNMCQCRRGYVGNGKTCSRTCYNQCGNGYCSGAPLYECICEIGWTSLPNQDTNCTVDCGCNFHSTCYQGIGKCDRCQHDTETSNCSRCKRGYFRHNNNMSCHPCQCNKHHQVLEGTPQMCDVTTGRCLCDDVTQGWYCEQCKPGYYGDSRNGGKCWLKCDGRIEFNATTSSGGLRQNYLFGVDHNPYNSPNNRFCYASISTDEHHVISLKITNIYSIGCTKSRILIYDSMSTTSLISSFCSQDVSQTTAVSRTGFMILIFESLAENSRFDAEFEIVQVEDFDEQPKFEAPFLYGSSMIYFNNSLLFFSGFTNDFQFNQKLYRLELDDDVRSSVSTSSSWNEMMTSTKSGETPQLRHLQGSILMENVRRWFVYGGLQGVDLYDDFADSSLWWTDVGVQSRDKWNHLSSSSVISTSPPRLAAHKMIFMTSYKFLLIGGFTRDFNFNREVWQFDVMAQTWSQICKTPDYASSVVGMATAYDPISNVLYVLDFCVDDGWIFISYDLTSNFVWINEKFPDTLTKYQSVDSLQSAVCAYSIDNGIILFDDHSLKTWIFVASKRKWFDVTSITATGRERICAYTGSSWYSHGNITSDVQLFVYGGIQQGTISNQLQIIEIRTSCLFNHDADLCKNNEVGASCCLLLRKSSQTMEDNCNDEQMNCPRSVYPRYNTINLRYDCDVHKSCQPCLLSTRCVWFENDDICVPNMASYALCPHGKCWGYSLLQDASLCKDCQAFKSCFNCLQHPRCGWFDSTSVSGCFNGILEKPHQLSKENNQESKWWYMSCPAQNECLMHDPGTLCGKFEECVDKEIGWDCVCQHGYYLQDGTCLPICHPSCVNGYCISADKCQCYDGYHGDACQLACNCNRMGTCKDNYRCTSCQYNSYGDNCGKCKPGYIGDPINSTQDPSTICKSCLSICNRRADLCWKSDVTNQITCNCTDDSNSEGLLCETCKDGYFENNKGKCVQCECNSLTDNVCDKKTGSQCKCAEDVISSRAECNNIPHYQDAPKHCWRFQCDKCASNNMGNPKSMSSPCYKWRKLGEYQCFNPDDPTRCHASMKMSSESIMHDGRYQLEGGKTIKFAVQPRQLTKAKYRIYVNVLRGKVDVFVAAYQSSYFRIIVDNVTHEDKVIVESDKRYFPNYRQPRNNNNKKDYISKLVTRTARSRQPHINDHVTMRRNQAVHVCDVSGRLVVTMVPPMRVTDDSFVYVIILAKKNDDDGGGMLNTTYDGVKRSKRQLYNRGGGGASGQFMFRQDEPRLDLFVFFSCFFCSFGVISVFSTAIWKMRLAMSNRRARINQALQMIPLARRPCRLIYVMIENSNIQHQHLEEIKDEHQTCAASSSSNFISTANTSTTQYRSILHCRDRADKTQQSTTTNKPVVIANSHNTASSHIPLPHNTADHVLVMQDPDEGMTLTPEDTSPSSSLSWTPPPPPKLVKSCKEKIVRFAPSPECLKRPSTPRLKAVKRPLITQPIYRDRSVSIITYLATLPGGSGCERSTPVFITTLAATNDISSTVFDDDTPSGSVDDLKKQDNSCAAGATRRATTILSHFTNSSSNN